MVICEETFLTDFGEINAFEVQFFSSSNIEWHAGRLSARAQRKLQLKFFYVLPIPPIIYVLANNIFFYPSPIFFPRV